MSVRLYENGELKEVANVGGGSDFEKVICDESEKEQLAEQGIIKDGMIVFTTGGDNNVKIEVDEELNAESTNPVENRAINQAINEVKESIPDVTPIQTVITQLQEAVATMQQKIAQQQQSINEINRKLDIENANIGLFKEWLNIQSTTGKFADIAPSNYTVNGRDMFSVIDSVCDNRVPTYTDKVWTKFENIGLGGNAYGGAVWKFNNDNFWGFISTYVMGPDVTFFSCSNGARSYINLGRLYSLQFNLQELS